MLNIRNEIWRRPLKNDVKITIFVAFPWLQKSSKICLKTKKKFTQEHLDLVFVPILIWDVGDNCRVRRFLLLKKLWHIKAEKVHAVVKRLFISYFMKNFLLIRRFRLLFNSIVYWEMQGLIWGENMWCVARFGNICTI